MLRKAIFITLFLAFAGALVAGAVYRTVERNTVAAAGPAAVLASGASGERQGLSRNTQASGERQGLNRDAQASGERQGLNRSAQAFGERQGLNRNAQASGEPQGLNRNAQEGGAGQAGAAGSAREPGRGQGTGQGAGQPNPGGYGATTEPIAPVTVPGSVQQAPATGVEMIVLTADGPLTVGTGPDYLGQIGFVLTVGDEVTLTGFYEDDQFKVMTITRTADGATATLRDPNGRPLWSGRGRSGG